VPNNIAKSENNAKKIALSDTEKFQFYHKKNIEKKKYCDMSDTEKL